MTKTNTTEQTDLARFHKERNAASDMRLEISYLTGLAKYDSPEISERLEKILEKHDQEREENWL